MKKEIYEMTKAKNLKKDKSEKLNYRELYRFAGDYNNPTIYRVVSRMISRKNESVVDLGCGAGNLYDYLPKKLQDNYLGLEVNSNLVEKGIDLGRNILCGDIFDYKYNSYDLVVMLEILEHIENCFSFLEKVVEQAKKEVIISVPHNEAPKSMIVCRKCGKLTPRTGHIHFGFTKKSFDYLKEKYDVDYKFVWKSMSKKLFFLISRKYLVVRIRK